MAIDISAVVQRSGVPASTLRFYEKKGLIASVGRRGNRRLFDEEVVEQLAFIALGGSAGFSLDEIAAMLTPGGDPLIDRATLAARASEIDDTIGRLTAISTWLKHAAECPAPTHMKCPSFRKYLDLAAEGSIERVFPRNPRSNASRRPPHRARAKSEGSQSAVP